MYLTERLEKCGMIVQQQGLNVVWRFIRQLVTKQVSEAILFFTYFISGQQAPPGKQMGHAGAIISSGSGSASEKIAAFEAVGVPVARETSEIPELLKKQLKK